MATRPSSIRPFEPCEPEVAQARLVGAQQPVPAERPRLPIAQRDDRRLVAHDALGVGVRRLLGVEGDIGPMLGLRRDWARVAIKAEGNYGEIFDRNVGSDSALDLARGLNAQWNATPGGLIYALPIR